MKGFVVFVELRGPHLVLAYDRGHDSIAVGLLVEFLDDLLHAQANSKSQEMAEAQCSALSAEMERNQFQLSHKSQNLNSQAQQLGLLEQQVEKQTAQGQHHQVGIHAGRQFRHECVHQPADVRQDVANHHLQPLPVPG